MNRHSIRLTLFAFLLIAACSETVEPRLQPIPVESGTYAVGADALKSLATSSLGGDTGPDLIIAAQSDATIRILVGAQGGTFGTSVSLPAESITQQVTTGDVNGDGITDIVVIGHDNAFNVRLGLGDQRFSAPVQYSLRNHGNRVVVANLNGDRFADIVAVHDGSGQPIYVTAYLGSATGEMHRAWELATDYFSSRGIATGDFDGDGRTDVAIAISDPRAAALILRGLGPDTAPPIELLPLVNASNGATDGASAIAAGDLNGDGRADLVIACYSLTNQLVIRRGAPSGFSAPVVIPLPSPIAVALGDVNGDGRLDVVAANLDHASLSLLYGNGDGTFASAISLPTGAAPAYIALGDFDRDGRADIATSSLGENAIRVFLTTGQVRH